MVSNPEGFTNNSPISSMISTPIKKLSAQKSLFMFTKMLYVKKTAYRQIGASKSKRKALKFGNTPWTLKKKRKGDSK